MFGHVLSAMFGIGETAERNRAAEAQAAMLAEQQRAMQQPHREGSGIITLDSSEFRRVDAPQPDPLAALENERIPVDHPDDAAGDLVGSRRPGEQVEQGG